MADKKDSIWQKMWKRIKGHVEEKILEEPSSTDIISKNAKSVLMGLFSLLGLAIIFYAITLSNDYFTDHYLERSEVITNTLSSSSSAPINVSMALVRAQEQFILAQQIHNNITNQLSNNINSPGLEIDTPTGATGGTTGPDEPGGTGGTGGTTGPDEPGGQVNSTKPKTETPKDTMRSQKLSESVAKLSESVANLTESQKNHVKSLNETQSQSLENVRAIEKVNDLRAEQQRIDQQVDQINAVFIAAIAGTLALGGTLITQLWGRKD